MSTFDRRRINGPEESYPPLFEDGHDVGDAYANWKVGEPRQRRSAGDVRPIFMKPGLINQANGSAYVETEKTKLVCAVYGPRQSRNTAYSERGRLNVEVKFTPFSCTKRRAPIRDAEDRSVAVQIHQAILPSVRLELLPKSTVDVFITIIENDGLESCYASGAVAASAALADAGIEMLGLVTSCSSSMVGKEIWLDPTEREISLAKGSLVLACMPALGIVTSVWQSGEVKPVEAIECMEACQERCADIHAIVSEALLANAKVI
ncbi:ribosomal protein S5 domain 2-like protein [Neolentinus lepideus HHB14362 ss-1]|uniref:Ribosomal protein S5 domain 2-like protein n=1 Tax=Neolentinus lepideus HHB14362 ss-1 TaxID=1314782 RepID=A0A165TA02_9AGAM|nr:ribosomal protein S5 domain 2-like protein [Neolentinus lepideus HHB14362 ss-1]